MGKLSKVDIVSLLQPGDIVTVERTIKGLDSGKYKDYMVLHYMGFGKVRVGDTRRNQIGC